MTGYEIYQNVKELLNLDPPGVEVHCLYGIGVLTLDKYGCPDLLNMFLLCVCVYWLHIYFQNDIRSR